MIQPRKNKRLNKINSKSAAPNGRQGFTLIELLVSVSIFVIVVFVAVGALINLANVNDKSQAFLIAFENLDFGLENMSRTIRDGSFYTCDVSGSLGVPTPVALGNDCATGKGFHFVDASNNKVMYRLQVSDWDGLPQTPDTGAVTRRRQTPSPNPVLQDEIPITSTEIDIKSMAFIVTGSRPEQASGGDPRHMQPRVLLLLKGTTVLKGVKPEEQADFNVQTTMSQRKDNRVVSPLP